MLIDVLKRHKLGLFGSITMRSLKMLNFAPNYSYLSLIGLLRLYLLEIAMAPLDSYLFP